MDGFISSFQSGQTCKISNAYVGMTDKIPTRVIVHRLFNEQQRLQDQTVREKRMK